MKVLLVGINSKFTHSNLAIKCIKHYAKSDDIMCYESNINVDTNKVLYDILSCKADIVAFSCYIFNIEYLKKLVPALSKISPQTKLLFGGPEPYGDDHIMGEGENYFYNLMHGTNHKDLINLDDLYGIYDESYLKANGTRPIYYEASRGCPFSCAYCMSGQGEKLREKSMPVIKKELDFFISSKVGQVKFLDRTFNANKVFAKEILNYILKTNIETAFHFEVSADLFDSEMLDIIAKFPSGILEFEIGIQSFNADTLKLLNRKSNLDKVVSNIKKLVALKNCHVHVDLIAGLPEQTYNSFIESFNYCYDLSPQYIQLGMLKLLKFTRLRDDKEKYGYEFYEQAPYEVLQNDAISYGEMFNLKLVEFVLGKFFNTKLFVQTVKYLIAKYKTPYNFYYELGKFIYNKGFYKGLLSKDKKISLMLEFGNQDEKVKQLLRYDYLAKENSQNLNHILFVEYDDSIKKLNKDKTKAHLYMDINPHTFKSEKVIVSFDRQKYDKTDEIFVSRVEKY